MSLYVTQFQAVDPETEEITTYGGEHVSANSFEEAEEFCRRHRGHLTVIGKLCAEIPTDSDYNPIWEGKIDYDTKQGLN